MTLEEATRLIGVIVWCRPSMGVLPFRVKIIGTENDKVRVAGTDYQSEKSDPYLVDSSALFTTLAV